MFLRGLCGETEWLGRPGSFRSTTETTERHRGIQFNSGSPGLPPPSQGRPCGALAAEGVADLGEVRGLVADVKDGGDRVGGLGLDVEGHAGGEGVGGAAMAPGERGPVLHRGRVRSPRHAAV